MRPELCTPPAASQRTRAPPPSAAGGASGVAAAASPRRHLAVARRALYAVLALSAGSAPGNDSGLIAIAQRFGAAAAIVSPLGYPLTGVLVGVAAAALYNLCARLTGGIDIDLS